MNVGQLDAGQQAALTRASRGFLYSLLCCLYNLICCLPRGISWLSERSKPAQAGTYELPVDNAYRPPAQQPAYCISELLAKASQRPNGVTAIGPMIERISNLAERRVAAVNSASTSEMQAFVTQLSAPGFHTIINGIIHFPESAAASIKGWTGAFAAGSKMYNIDWVERTPTRCSFTYDGEYNAKQFRGMCEIYVTQEGLILLEVWTLLGQLMRSGTFRKGSIAKVPTWSPAEQPTLVGRNKSVLLRRAQIINSSNVGEIIKYLQECEAPSSSRCVLGKWTDCDHSTLVSHLQSAIQRVGYVFEPFDYYEFAYILPWIYRDRWCKISTGSVKRHTEYNTHIPADGKERP